MGLQSGQHAGLQGGSDKTEGSSDHPRARSSFSSAHVDCMKNTKRKTCDCHLLFCCFCIFIQVLANGTFSWPLPTGNQYGCPSSLNHPSFSCLSRKGGGPGRGQTGGSPSRKWDREATLVEHLDCYSGAFISVCSLHSCLKCLIKLYKLYFVVLCGCSPFRSWCWISKLVGGRR